MENRQETNRKNTEGEQKVLSKRKMVGFEKKGGGGKGAETKKERNTRKQIKTNTTISNHNSSPLANFHRRNTNIHANVHLSPGGIHTFPGN